MTFAEPDDYKLNRYYISTRNIVASHLEKPGVCLAGLKPMSYYGPTVDVIDSVGV